MPIHTNTLNITAIKTVFLRRDVRQFCCRCGCGHHDNDAEDTPTNNLVDGLMMMNNTRESLYHKERSPVSTTLTPGGAGSIGLV